jgi:hypothetical protein
MYAALACTSRCTGHETLLGAWPAALHACILLYADTASLLKAMQRTINALKHLHYCCMNNECESAFA